MAEKLCNVPECGCSIDARSISGVCRDHAHMKGFCLCRACRASAESQRPEAAEDRVIPGTRVATVTFLASTAAAAGKAKVRVSAEPWLNRRPAAWEIQGRTRGTHVSPAASLAPDEAAPGA
jgi:hypothetical protein